VDWPQLRPTKLLLELNSRLHRSNLRDRKKPEPAFSGKIVGGPGTADPIQLRGTRVTLLNLVRSAYDYIIRSERIEELEGLRRKVHRCFEAGAIATGSTLRMTGGNKPYAQVRHDFEIADLYRRNAEALGRVFSDLGPQAERLAASTDMGNVSLAIPAIHPTIGIESLPAVNHQPEFARHCITEKADRAVYDGALAMAWTAIDMAGSEKLRARLMAA